MHFNLLFLICALQLRSEFWILQSWINEFLYILTNCKLDHYFNWQYPPILKISDTSKCVLFERRGTFLTVAKIEWKVELWTFLIYISVSVFAAYFSSLHPEVQSIRIVLTSEIQVFQMFTRQRHRLPIQFRNVPQVN